MDCGSPSLSLSPLFPFFNRRPISVMGALQSLLHMLSALEAHWWATKRQQLYFLLPLLPLLQPLNKKTTMAVVSSFAFRLWSSLADVWLILLHLRSLSKTARAALRWIWTSNEASTHPFYSASRHWSPLFSCTQGHGDLLEPSRLS